MNGINNVGGTQSVNQINETSATKAYQPKVDLSDPVDEVQFSNKEAAPKKSGVGKKLATAFTSAIIPGLGQLINGDTKSAAKHFFGFYGSGVAEVIGIGLMASCPPVGLACVAAGTIGALGTYVHGIVDAYKDA